MGLVERMLSGRVLSGGEVGNCFLGDSCGSVGGRRDRRLLLFSRWVRDVEFERCKG